MIGTGFPYDKDVNPDNNVDNVARILPHLRGLRRMGSAAYDLCCVAAGFLDGYLGIQSEPLGHVCWSLNSRGSWRNHPPFSPEPECFHHRR